MTREEFVNRWSQGFPGLAEEPFEFERNLDALLDAERAKAREEQREVDRLWVVDVLSTRGSAFDLWQIRERHAGTMQSTLTATPLADRIAGLERERDEARNRIAELELDSRLCAQLCAVLGREVGKTGESEGAVQVAERIIRERDEARALAKTAGEALLAAGLVVLPERCSPRCSSNAAQFGEDNRCDCGREEGEHRNKVCEDALSALRAAGVLS